MTSVLAVDPGGTTGFCLWRGTEDWKAWAEPEPRLAAATIHTRLAARDIDVLIMENFYITKFTAQKSQDGKVSIELIGVGWYLAPLYDVAFVLQPPSDAKHFATDAKLKAMGMWTKGVDHPRDATRHALLYVARNNLIDLGALREALD